MAGNLGEGNNPNRDCEILYKFFNYILQRWGRELNKRSEKEKCSRDGRLASARFTQTAEHVKPLFKGLNDKTLALDMQVMLTPIVQCLLDENYVDANNAFLELGVGNVLWPLGVTRSNFHVRPKCEEIYEKNIKHVMNDEVQRKYIQAVKRFITKFQEYFPSDPSKAGYVPNDKDFLEPVII